MREQLQRFGPALLCAALAWSAWPAFSEAERAAKTERTRPQPVTKAALARRAADEPPPAMRDAFFADWAPYGPQYAPEHLAAERRREEEARAAAVRAANEAELARRKAEIEGSSARPAAVEPSSFTLSLEAVLSSSEGASARVCGRTVEPGAPIPGLGVDPAPVLARVDGDAVEVTWRGAAWIVRLGAPVVVAVRGDAPVRAEPPAREEAAR